MGAMEIGVIIFSVIFIVGFMILNHHVSARLRKYEKENKPTK